MTGSLQPRRRKTPLSTAARLLPPALVQLPIGRLALPEATTTLLAENEVTTVGDMLALPARAFTGKAGWFVASHAQGSATPGEGDGQRRGPRHGLGRSRRGRATGRDPPTGRL
jgi:hypothetical protein